MYKYLLVSILGFTFGCFIHHNYQKHQEKQQTKQPHYTAPKSSKQAVSSESVMTEPNNIPDKTQLPQAPVKEIAPIEVVEQPKEPRFLDIEPTVITETQEEETREPEVSIQDTFKFIEQKGIKGKTIRDDEDYAKVTFSYRDTAHEVSKSITGVNVNYAWESDDYVKKVDLGSKIQEYGIGSLRYPG